MATKVYAERRDVYNFGLPRGTLGSSARMIAHVDVATSTFELDCHGFEERDNIVVRAAQGGSVPAPLVSGATYAVIRVSDSMFQVSEQLQATPINLTSEGASVIVAIELPFDAILEACSRWVDDLLPAHAVPLDEPYPVTIVAVTAELAARKLQSIAGHASVSVNEYELAAKAKLERWAAGIPLRNVDATRSTNLSTLATASATGAGFGKGRIP